MALRKIINWLTQRGKEPAAGEVSEPAAQDTPPIPVVNASGGPFSVVISTPDYFDGEHDIVEEMFEAGLSRFHLRKSRFSFREWCEWIEAIPEKWYDRIVVHNQWRIAEKFGLGGLHLRSGNRSPEGFPEQIQMSFSCSNFDDMARVRRAAYLTLGPVFPSEDANRQHRSRDRDRDRDSEPQRTPEEYAVILESWRENPRRCPVLALGGVSAENVAHARKLGFEGFAVVGSVWDAADPVAGFRALLSNWGGK